MTEAVIWYFFAAMTVFAGCIVAFSRHVVHSGVALLFALLGVCAMYVFLGADFLAVTQVVVYVGGILVLVLFAVMMTNRIMTSSLREEIMQPATALGASAVVLALLLLVIHRTAWPLVETAEALPTTKAIGRAFLTDWLFPFEFTSILLLVAMIGAAMIIREQKDEEGEAQ